MRESRILRQLALGAYGMLFAVTPVCAFTPGKPSPPGWHGKVTFGAHAVVGSSRSEHLVAATDFSYRDDRFENRFTFELSRTASTISTILRDGSGDPLVDRQGRVLQQIVKTRTSDRRFAGVQPHWFWNRRNYLMAILDWESNEPQDIRYAARLIAGIGHKLWNSQDDLLAAEIGVGEKRLQQMSGTRREDAIGYVGLKFVRDITERARTSVELDSDFGSDNRFTQLKLALRYKLTQTVALKFRLTSRINSDITDPRNPLDSDADSESAIYLEIDMF